MAAEQLPISVIVLTFNEEANIGPCLDTVADWAKEIFVVDSGSTDLTLDIVAKYTKNILRHPFENYSRQRNWAQSNLALANEWVFHIDADERVTPQLAESIRNFFATISDADHISGLMLRRKIIFFGEPIVHGGLYPTYHCRIFRKQHGCCEDREYDQHFLVEGSTCTIEADLLELTASSLFSWTARHNKWAQMEAQQLRKGCRELDPTSIQPKILGSPIERRRWLRLSVYARTPIFFRAFLYFLSRYFLRGGFLDGIPGLIYHVLQGFWFRFYVDACYYELQQKREVRTQTSEK
jgi:glycosyltransferase involved in cell wall biosynthesis